MPQMTAVQVTRPGAPFEVVKRSIPEPGPDQVRIQVQACGICHSDAFVKEGHWPGLEYPRVTGHEIAGVIDGIGPHVTAWRKGQYVGVGWHGGHCGLCVACRRGDFIACERLSVTGFNADGGYAHYMIARADTLALIPDTISPAEAAPLLCAGITTFNSLRHSGAVAGSRRRTGLGRPRTPGYSVRPQDGLPHGRDRTRQGQGTIGQRLGAHQYLDSDTVNVAQELTKQGGASVILATAPNGKAMSNLIDALGVGGTLLVVGASADPITVTPIQLIGKRRSIQGWPSGTARGSEETLNFCALTGIRPMVERFPLEQAGPAYDRMITGKARFRAVLTMD